VRPNNNDLTFSIVGGGPAHGSLGSISASSCSGGDCTATVTYTPGPDYNGPDSFNFKVNNGNADSNTSTVSIGVSEVNDSLVAANDAKSMNQDTTLNFPASFLTANDVAGPANENGQTMTVNSVTATANTHGTVALSNGMVILRHHAVKTFTRLLFINGLSASANDLPLDGAICLLSVLHYFIVHVD